MELNLPVCHLTVRLEDIKKNEFFEAKSNN